MAESRRTFLRLSAVAGTPLLAGLGGARRVWAQARTPARSLTLPPEGGSHEMQTPQAPGVSHTIQTPVLTIGYEDRGDPQA